MIAIVIEPELDEEDPPDELDEEDPPDELDEEDPPDELLDDAPPDEELLEVLEGLHIPTPGLKVFVLHPGKLF